MLCSDSVKTETIHITCTHSLKETKDGLPLNYKLMQQTMQVTELKKETYNSLHKHNFIHTTFIHTKNAVPFAMPTQLKQKLTIIPYKNH